MRKALAAIVILTFTSLICSSMLAMFSGTMLVHRYQHSQGIGYPYFMAY